MKWTSLQVATIYAAFVGTTNALQVAPGSPCALQCLDNINDNPTDPTSSNTFGTDISCQNTDYATSSSGQKFQTCLTCLQTSSYVTSTESDQAWFLYNLRFAVDWCLFGYPNNPTTIGGPCILSTSCGPLAPGLTTQTSGTYDYCTAGGGVFGTSSLLQCTQCLQSDGPHTYLGNFMTALQAGCKQKPSDGATLGLSGALFTSTSVTITAVKPPPSPSSSTSSSSSLSPGVIAGIVIGMFAVLGLIVGLTIICVKKRQRQNLLARSSSRQSGPALKASPKGTFPTPQYQPPIHMSSIWQDSRRQAAPYELDLERVNVNLNKFTTPEKPVSFEKASTVSAESSKQSSPSYSQKQFAPMTGMPVHAAYIPSEHFVMAEVATTAALHGNTYTQSHTAQQPHKGPSGHGASNSLEGTSTSIPYESVPMQTVAAGNTHATHKPKSSHMSLAPQRAHHLTMPIQANLAVPGLLGQNWSPDSQRSVELWPGKY